ncbi:MAG: hypothetical protein ABIR24_14085 [Verrucomicrobiota bacterium]
MNELICFTQSSRHPGAGFFVDCGVLVFALGSTGHWPVPSGDPPLGTEKTHDLFRASISRANVLPIPSGQWPDGTGESPVLPIRTFNYFLCAAARKIRSKP